jgi:SlyX protein
MDDNRLERMEERIAWLERHVQEQDKVMLAQSEELSNLRQALINLRERSASREAPLDPNERPPHY